MIVRHRTRNAATNNALWWKEKEPANAFRMETAETNRIRNAVETVAKPFKDPEPTNATIIRTANPSTPNATTNNNA
jgi:hypothetical protein